MIAVILLAGPLIFAIPEPPADWFEVDSQTYLKCGHSGEMVTLPDVIFAGENRTFIVADCLKQARAGGDRGGARAAQQGARCRSIFQPRLCGIENGTV